VSGTEHERRGGVLEQTERRTDEPRQFRVVLLNDDYTSMDFVVDVLEAIFDKSPAEAYRIMMQVHTAGAGTAGRYPWEVAETKVDLVHDRAREAGYPLRASIEDD
jgi:ATP-dependent Clp protease adaptor protein ClpS